jgi:uncharacterized protein YegP (UPF0339 family)
MAALNRARQAPATLFVGAYWHSVLTARHTTCHFQVIGFAVEADPTACEDSTMLTRRGWLGIGAAAVASGLAASAVTSAQDKADSGLTFELFKDAKEEFRWRLKATNGQTIATSGEGYKAKADCMKAIESIRLGASKAKVDDQSAKK